MDDTDREWLTDMLEYAEKAVRILASRDAAQLLADETAYLAISYAVQTVGEAANHLSPEARQLLPGVPWSDIVGMRHRIVHHYRARSAAVIADTVHDDLPVLIAALRRALSEEAK